MIYIPEGTISVCTYYVHVLYHTMFIYKITKYHYKDKIEFCRTESQVFSFDRYQFIAIKIKQ